MQDQRQKEVIYAAGTIIGAPLLVTPAGQTMQCANGAAGAIGGSVNAVAQGLTNEWSNVNYFDVGVAAATGYMGAISQVALLGRYRAGFIGQTSSVGTATAINIGGTMGRNWIKGDGNYNVSATVVGTLGYPVGYYFGG